MTRLMARFARGIKREEYRNLVNQRIILLPLLLNINYLKVLLNCSPAASAFLEINPDQAGEKLFYNNNYLN